MKTKITVLILLGLSISVFSQCPDAKALEYKKKLQNVGRGDIEASEAYSQIAAYYHYKCKCRHGVGNPEGFKQQINHLVGVINGMYSKYATVSKVSSCKETGSGNNTTEAGNNTSSIGSKSVPDKYNLETTRKIEDLSSSLLGEDHELTKSFKSYNQGVEIRKALDNGDYTSAINTFGSALMNAYEADRQHRLQVLAEQKRKEKFIEQVKAYREEIKSIIKSRKQYFSNQKAISTYDKDGTKFEPIYTFFAFSQRGTNNIEDYNYYYENVRYPNTIDLKFNKNAEINFSKIYGVFPSSDGYYPFFNDLKKQIFSEYSNINIAKYDIIFFPFSKSINGYNGVLKRYQSEMNKSINEAKYNKAIPNLEGEIRYLSVKSTQTESNYWYEKKDKEKKDINYWETDSKKQTKKTPVKKKSNKTDYWN